jgi:phosphatidylglycerophosphate synthase
MTWDGDLLYLVGFVAFFSTPFLIYLILLLHGAVHLAPTRPKASGRRLFGPVFVGYYYWLMGPLFRLALRSGVSPNQVTLATLVVAAAASVAIGTGHFALASALLIAGGSLDILDGHLARLKKMATSQGAFLDSTVDRICDGLIFGGCVVYYARTPMILVCLAVLIMSFTVSYARGRAEALGVSGAEGLMQRADRLTVLGIALAFSPFFAHRTEGHVARPFYAITAVSLCLLAVLSTVTAISRILWTLKELRRRQISLMLEDPRDRPEQPALNLTNLRASQTTGHLVTPQEPAVGSHR